MNWIKIPYAYEKKMQTVAVRQVILDRFIGAGFFEVTEQTKSRFAAFRTEATIAVLGAILMGILAQISFYIGVVPVTGQTFGVMVLGVVLGMHRAVTAMGTYIGLGLIGMPWFAGFSGGPMMIFKPTFGYICGFVLAAALVGWLANRGWDKHIVKAWVMYAAASLSIYLVGLPYLWACAHFSGTTLGVSDLLNLGFWPFLLADAMKCSLAAGLSPLVWKAINRLLP